MPLERAKHLLEEARTLHDEGRCVSSIKKAQEAVRAALIELLKNLGVEEPVGSLREYLQNLPPEAKRGFVRMLEEACQKSKWISLACEARLEGSVEAPTQGACSRLDSESAIAIAEQIIRLVEEILSP